jgi:GNAT superfamily N-acetyltransferase
MIHHPERTPPAIAHGYPAHLHVNLLPRVQGHGVGSKLVEAWLDLAARRGAGAAHVGVNGANLRAIRFWGRHGFAEVKPEGGQASRTIWMGR